VDGAPTLCSNAVGVIQTHVYTRYGRRSDSKLSFALLCLSSTSSGFRTPSRAGTLAAGLDFALPEAAHSAESVGQLLHSLPAPAPLFDIAQDTPFWENLARYGQYFFSVMLGTGYVMLKPFAALLKRPVTAVLLIAFAIGLFFLVKRTVQAMLGTNDLFEYNPIGDLPAPPPLERSREP
jgi:Protein of unknown function (DUF751)